MFFMMDGPWYGRLIVGVLIVLCIISAIKAIKGMKEQDKTQKNQNLVEHFDDFNKAERNRALWQRWRQPSWHAMTITDVNMRTGPGLNYDVIQVVKKGTQVYLGPAAERNGDWFQIRVNNKGGWVHGKYLRPATSGEVDYIFRDIINLSLKFAFPEKTFLGKLLGYVIGMIISGILSIILKDHEKVHIIVFIITWSYFCIKDYPVIDFHRPIETVFLAGSITVVAAICSVPTGIILKAMFEE